MGRETGIQRQIEAAIGALPDLLVLRNSVGAAKYVDERSGKEWTVPYGLGAGSPDLVGILAPTGRWVCLEVKVPGEKPRANQRECHALWRKFGAFIATVTSSKEAIAAVERARKGANQ